MDVTVVAVTAIVTGNLMLLGAFSAWLRYRGGRGVRAAQAGQDVQADRLERLAEDVGALRVALEAVAVEVERLGEGQRYASRLLQERPDAAPAGVVAPAGIVTPH